MAAVFNVHIQILVDITFHANIKFFKQFGNHSIPIFFLFGNVCIRRNNQFTPSLNFGFGI